MEENVSRKDFFKLAFKGAKNCAFELLDGVRTAAQILEEAAAQKPAPLQNWVRPPGALPEPQFLAACTRCDDCVKACPHWVIRKTGPEFGGSVANTPIVIPNNNPCLFCQDLPCIAACTTGALLQAPSGILHIGTAVVDPQACYQAQGQPCDYCMVHCPQRPKAIRTGSPGSLPEVDLETCTGCGKCAQICPPNAIRIVMPQR